MVEDRTSPIVFELTNPFEILDDNTNTSSMLKDKGQLEQTYSPYACSCSVCHIQCRGKVMTAAPFAIDDSDLLVYGQQKGFIWLAEKLGEASLEKGIKINIPETAVFRQGKPAFIISPSREKTIKYVKSGDKLKIQELMKNFANIVKLRKRESSTVGPMRRLRSILNGSKPNTNEHRNEILCARYFFGDKDNYAQNLHPREEEGPIKVMDENEIFQIMYDAPGSNYWKHISYIQTALKCKNAIGESILFTYYSHKKEDVHAIGELKNAGIMENSEYEEKLLADNQSEYCKLICQRIAYFLAVQSHFELLKMQAEFVLDENGKMWLIFANKIFVREIHISNEAAPLVFKKVQVVSKERKLELEKHLLVSAGEKSAIGERVALKMSQYYENLKEKCGVNLLFEAAPWVGTLSEDFNKLRPLMKCNRIEHKGLVFKKKKKQRNSLQPKLTIDTKPESQLMEISSMSQRRLGWTITPKIKFSNLDSRPLSSRSKLSSTCLSKFYTSASTHRLDTLQSL